MDSNRPLFGIHDYLVISKVGLPANQSLVGKRLIEAGVLPADTFTCEIDTQGLGTIDVYVNPSAATSGGTPALSSVSLNAARTALDTATGVAFVTNTLQKLSLTGLNGTKRCLLSFTVTTSLDFTPSGANGRAEVRGI